MSEKKQLELFEALKKRVGDIGIKFYEKFNEEIKIKDSDNIKKDIQEILFKALPDYKNLTDIKEKSNLVNSIECKILKKIKVTDKQFIKIINESLLEVFKQADDVIENSVTDQQREIGLVQLMTVYGNVINTNHIKINNKDEINSSVFGIQDRLNSVGEFWILDGPKSKYLEDIINVIILSVKVNRFEDEWEQELIMDLFKDSIEKFSSFIPQNMIIKGLEVVFEKGSISDEDYKIILEETKENIKGL